MTSVDNDHERWSELAAGHALSSLDDADEAAYLRHAQNCSTCQQLAGDFAATLSDLGRVTPRSAPPPSLKAAIMTSIADDAAVNTPPADLSARRAQRVDGKNRLLTWGSAAAAVVVIAVAIAGWAVTRSKPVSVAQRCVNAHCPTIALTADGHQVATVMVLDDVAYLQPTDLPATPSGHSYVLWWISAGEPPVGIAALRLQPSDGAVKAGSLTVPMAEVAAFALSEEPGTAVPASPSHVLAEGAVT